MVGRLERKMPALSDERDKHVVKLESESGQMMHTDVIPSFKAMTRSPIENASGKR